MSVSFSKSVVALLLGLTLGSDSLGPDSLGFVSVARGDSGDDDRPTATTPDQEVPATRPEQKAALEALKRRQSRLPLPSTTSGPSVNNGRSRRHYLPPEWYAADFKDDPTMTLDPTFKVKLFWIVSRGNDCRYCLGHQEVKLSAAGVKEDEIASIDLNWSVFAEPDVAAFDYARQATLDPSRIDAAVWEKLAQHYTPEQIVEIVHTVAMFNSVNRWTDGMGLPQDDRMRDHDVRFDAPTSAPFLTGRSLVAPLEREARRALEDRDTVERWFTELTVRHARVSSPESTPDWVRDLGFRGSVPQWVQAWSRYPTIGPVLVRAHRAIRGGEGLDPELAAVVAWVAARHDRAWYALRDAERRLEKLGWTEAKIEALDSPATLDAPMGKVVTFVAKSTCTPELISDEDLAGLRESFDDVTVARMLFATGAANQFNRFTEGLQLPADEDDVELQDPLGEVGYAALERLAGLDPKSEAAAMRDAILAGSRLGPDEGWFGMAKEASRYRWDRLVATRDTDGDGKWSLEEFGGSEQAFATLDRDHDEMITKSDVDGQSPDEGRGFWSAMRRIDANGDGRITAEEFDAERSRLFEAKQGSDSWEREFVSIDELRATWVPARSPFAPPPADRPSRDTLLKALADQEIGSLLPGPGLDSVAPDFSLPTLDGGSFTLSKTVGSKPVVLIFGNFTCGPFRGEAGNLQRLFETYQDRVNFVMVYVREAHPKGGWWMESNERRGVTIDQPASQEERTEVAARCAEHLGFPITVAVDTLDDAVGGLYSGMPARLYLLDGEGKVAFKSGRGPYGFDAGRLEQALVLLLEGL